MEATIEVTDLRKRFGQTVGARRHLVHGHARERDRVRRPQRRRASRPRCGSSSVSTRPISGSALIGGQPYASLRHPLRHVGSLLDAAALHPSRSARNHLLWLAHSQGLSARRVDEVIEQAGPARRWRAARPAASRSGCASGSGSPRRCSATRRADSRRAVQRHGPGGDRLDARLPARARRRGPGGARLQPPDERAGGHRHASGRDRPRQARRRHERRRADRRRLRRPGHAAHQRAHRAR